MENQFLRFACLTSCHFIFWLMVLTSQAFAQTQRPACALSDRSASVVQSLKASQADSKRQACSPALEVFDGWGTAPTLLVLPDNRIRAFLLTSNRPGEKGIHVRVLETSDTGMTWRIAGRFYDLPNRKQGANQHVGTPNIVRLDDGRLFAAFVDHTVVRRHGSGSKSKRVWQYTLRTAKSFDDGASWRPLGQIDTMRHTSRGLWEPFIFRHSSGGPIQVYYARERNRKITCPRKRGDAQDIVVAESTDGGRTFGRARVVLGRGGSREGVPSVVELVDGSLLMAFETWNRTACNDLDPRLTVGLARSCDRGRTWRYLKNAVRLPRSKKSRRPGPICCGSKMDGSR